MSPTPCIKPDDCRFQHLTRFCDEEGLNLSTMNRRKVKDPKFPSPRLGKKYWRPDLIAYAYNITL